jgi:hypothetical protein
LLRGRIDADLRKQGVLVEERDALQIVFRSHLDDLIGVLVDRIEGAEDILEAAGVDRRRRPMCNNDRELVALDQGSDGQGRAAAIGPE